MTRPGHVIDDKGRVKAAGEYVGRVVQLRNRRWVYGRPGSPASTLQYRDAAEAAQALMDAVIVEGAV